MDYFKTSLIFCMLYLLIINGIQSLTVQIFPDKEGILGPSDLKLSCVFTPATGETVLGINIQAEIKGVFEDIASFEPALNGNAQFIAPAGNYLSSRANVSNPSPSSPNTATITFNQIDCEDEMQYKCKVLFKTSSGQFTDQLSDATSITVKGMPAVPDNVPTWTPESGIEEGTDVTFTCTGNIGKPAGRFRWTKYRGSTPTEYDAVTTTSVVMPGTCTFNGTSQLTLKLQAEDNNAVIKCEVVQELATSNMYKQTQPDNLVVYYQVRNVNIVTSPNLPAYAEGATSITMTCSAQGNPPPIFTWYRDSDRNTTLTTGNTFILRETDVVVNNTGSYVCVGHNTVNGKDYELEQYVSIKIDKTTTQAPTTTPLPNSSDPAATKAPQLQNEEEGLSTGAIAGIAVGVICAIIVIVIVGVICMKKRQSKEDSFDEPPEKPRNNLSYVEQPDALGNKNGPFNNDIHYADLAFEDRPRSRKPLNLSMDSDLNQTPYSEVMMPRV